MAEARNMEEYVYGPEGDDAKSVKASVKRAQESATQREWAQIRVECRTHPTGSSSSTQEWVHMIPVDAPADAVTSALMNKLVSSPGEGFVGTIRMSFMDPSNSSTRVESYQRKIRSGLLPSGGDVPAGTGQLRAHVDDALKPHIDMTLRALDRGVALMDAAARVLTSSHPPVPEKGANGDQGMLPSLLRGALEVASASNEADRAKAAGTTVVTLATVPTPQWSASGTVNPPSPISYPTRVQPPGLPGSHPGQRALPGPTAGANGKQKLTDAEIEQWARENPAAAKRLGVRLWQEGT